MIRRLASALLWAFAGALALYVLLPDPSPESIPHIITHTEILEAREPDTVRTFVDRIVYRTPEPDQVATAPGGAEADVAAYCASAVARALEEARPELHPAPAKAQAVTPGPAHLLFRSVRYDAGFLTRPDRVSFTGPLSTGDLQEWTFSARGSWTARAHGREILFRRPRWDVLAEMLEVAVPLAGGILLGTVF